MITYTCKQMQVCEEGAAVFKEVTVEEADKLAEAGLLWHDLSPFGEGDWPQVWPATRSPPSQFISVGTHIKRKFYVLLEE